MRWGDRPAGVFDPTDGLGESDGLGAMIGVFEGAGDGVASTVGVAVGTSGVAVPFVQSGMKPNSKFVGTLGASAPPAAPRRRATDRDAKSTR